MRALGFEAFVTSRLDGFRAQGLGLRFDDLRILGLRSFTVQGFANLRLQGLRFGV